MGHGGLRVAPAPAPEPSGDGNHIDPTPHEGVGFFVSVFDGAGIEEIDIR